MSMKEKLAVTVLVTTLALFGLVVVLYRMIKDKNEDYTQIVLNQHSSYDSRTIPYRRGDIVDRNGTYLATSEKVYNLILDRTRSTRIKRTTWNRRWPHSVRYSDTTGQIFWRRSPPMKIPTMCLMRNRSPQTRRKNLRQKERAE